MVPITRIVRIPITRIVQNRPYPVIQKTTTTCMYVCMYHACMYVCMYFCNSNSSRGGMRAELWRFKGFLVGARTGHYTDLDGPSVSDFLVPGNFRCQCFPQGFVALWLKAPWLSFVWWCCGCHASDEVFCASFGKEED